MSLFKQTLLEALETVTETASAIAKKHGISQSQMSAFTSGEAIPKDKTMVALCDAFSLPVATKLAQAWVQQRLGPDMAERILCASDAGGGSKIDRLFSSLPLSTQNSFATLMAEARSNEDLRISLERLASYIKPAELIVEPTARFKVTKVYGDVIKPTAAEKKASVLNEDPPAAPELDSNRLRRRLDTAAKRGSSTR